MGSSTKKKASKQKDFQKPKLKVGKARPKPTNFTDTSFKAKAITVNHQSLTTTAPTATIQFTHHLSLLSSRSSTQRRDSLAYLTTAITARSITRPLPQPVSVLLSKVSPLILDGSTSVRSQLLHFLHALPHQDIDSHIFPLLLYIRAGLTHLAADIRSSTVDILTWALEASGPALISCPGGFIKTLRTLLLVLNWPVSDTLQTKGAEAWTTAPAPPASILNTKLLTLLALFLRTALLPTSNSADTDQPHDPWPFPLRHTQAHLLPTRSHAFTHLNLFGAPRDEEGEMYEDVADRRRVFRARGFEAAVGKGVDDAKREGGETGRAAAKLLKVLKEARGLMDGEE